MPGGVPAISGTKLAKLLVADGWIKTRQSPHGTGYHKQFPSGGRITTIPRTNESLAPSTLGSILGPMQTQIGRAGLLRLIKKYE